MTRPPHLVIPGLPPSVIPDPDRGPTPASFWPLIRNPSSHRRTGVGRYPGDGRGHPQNRHPPPTPPPPLPSYRRRNVTPYPDTGPVPRGAARLPPQPSSPTNAPSPLPPSYRRRPVPMGAARLPPQPRHFPHPTPSSLTVVPAKERHPVPRYGAGTQGTGAVTPINIRITKRPTPTQP